MALAPQDCPTRTARDTRDPSLRAQGLSERSAGHELGRERRPEPAVSAPDLGPPGSSVCPGFVPAARADEHTAPGGNTAVCGEMALSQSSGQGASWGKRPAGGGEGGRRQEATRAPRPRSQDRGPDTGSCSPGRGCHWPARGELLEWPRREVAETQNWGTDERSGAAVSGYRVSDRRPRGPAGNHRGLGPSDCRWGWGAGPGRGGRHRVLKSPALLIPGSLHGHSPRRAQEPGRVGEHSCGTCPSVRLCGPWLQAQEQDISNH